MKRVTHLACAAALMATPVFAGGHATWSSVDDASVVAFGSVKKDTVGEVHHFETVSGTVSEAGVVEVSIDLASVETNIDIRNERIGAHVFGDATTATLLGKIDMDEVSDLAIGDMAIVDLEGTLSFAGASVDVEAEMLVARLGEDRVLVTTADFIWLSTEDLGINAGIDKLMELAKLPGITRATPVSVRMVFEK